MDEKTDAALKTHYRQLALICVALVIAAANYIVIAYLVSRSGSTLDTVQLPVVLIAVIGLIFLGMAPVVFRMMMQKLSSTSPLETRITRLKFATIVSFAVREAAAIAGFVVTMVTGDLRWVIALSGITVIAMVAAFPRWSSFEKEVNTVPSEF